MGTLNKISKIIINELGTKREVTVKSQVTAFNCVNHEWGTMKEKYSNFVICLQLGVIEKTQGALTKV